MRSILTLLLTIFFMTASFSQDNSFEELWNQVEDLELKGLPQSALKILNSIDSLAVKNKDAAQKIKVLVFRSKFILILEEDAQLKIMNDFKEEIEANEYPVKNFLHSMLANLYWRYFQDNRWRFYNRTHTQTPVDPMDFRTWDLATIFGQIDHHYSKSLDNGLQLKIDTVEKFDLLINQTEDSRIYRPSLYDFLAHRALEFYRTDETSITKPSYKFEIDDRDYLGTAEEFSRLNLNSRDSSSLQLKALQIFQDLTIFHLKDDQPEALVDLNIHRFNFVREKAVFQAVEEALMETLDKEIQHLGAHNSVGLYKLEKARLLYDQGKRYDAEKNSSDRWRLKEAFELCKGIIADYPGSRAARNSEILVSRIENSSINIQAESFVPSNSKSRILLSYANHRRMNIRIFPISRKDYLRLKKTFRPDEQFELFKSLQPEYSWNTLLRDDGDFQNHTTEVMIPELNTGYHLILIMPDPGNEKVFAFETIQATDLALVQKPDYNPAVFQLIERNNGSVFKGATIDVTYLRYGGESYSETKVSDKNGEFRIKPYQNNHNVSFKVRFKKDNAYFDDLFVRSYGQTKGKEDYANAFVFTDRSIYRPGQTVYFKAIAMRSDGNKSEVLAGKSFTVELRDVNNSMLESLELKSNDFGSVSGSFVLPDQGLNGEYRLYIQSNSGRQNIRQSHYFSVEEYKRPRFKVEFPPVSGSFKLNDSIKISAKALAYAGPAVSEAKVVYRVTRQVNFPGWYYWYRPWFSSEPREIARGETSTDKSGNFDIEFIALPDLSVSADSQPVFSYEIKADITDINGETRSQTTVVKVGYHSMIASMELDEKLDKRNRDHKIKIKTVNLNDEKVAATGTIKIFKLRSPERVLRPRPWPAPDYQVIPEKTFVAAFPHEAYINEHDSRNWGKGKLVFETEFNSKLSEAVELGNIRNWESGLYIIELNSTDSFGQAVTDKLKTTVLSHNDAKPADNQLLDFSTDRTSYRPGERVNIRLSSAAHNLVTVDIEKDQKVVKREIIELNNNSRTISIPVNPDDLGGFAVLISTATFNSYQTESILIDVPYPSRELDIETRTFRDKLLPGEDETWSFKIKGPNGEKITAELLAGMYDASLDQFKAHNWSFNPFPRSTYYAFGQRQAGFSFGTKQFIVRQAQRGYRGLISPNYDLLNWFGFDLFNSWNYDQYLNNLRRSKNIQKTGKISGRVSDASGPLPGVNIVVKGTATGTQTDFDGMYEVDAQKGETLLFSYVGFVSREIVIGDSKIIDVILEEDSDALEELVVTGQGIARGERALGYAISDANDEMEIEDAKSMLAIRASGMQAEKQSISDDNLGFEAFNLRSNFQETAFFYPELRTDMEGNISFEFTSPEALTQWKLQLLAHTTDGKYVTKSFKTVTQKDLMVLPNPPRFVREGDSIVLSSKIANLTNSELTGQAALQLFDAISGKAVDNEFSNSKAIKEFTVGAEGNTEVSWSLKVPYTVQALQYKIMAKSGQVSDGEQNVLPVLSNRMLVTETMPLWVGSGETRSFTMDKLNKLDSKSLKHHRLTLEVTSNPSWYAVQAMPYLMEFPHDCNEQIFSRLYSNSLATDLMNSQPRIRAIFDQWKRSGALVSNLEKNQELKSILTEETPWLRDSQSETEQKKRMALLFDLNKMRSEMKASVRKLQRNQYPNGSWAWFEGGPDNRYITQHIVSGFGHLRKLGVVTEDTENMVYKALDYLDNEFVQTYKDIRKYDKDADLDADHLDYIQLHYLYTRSFFTEYDIPKENREIIDYYLGQIQRYWLERNLYSKALMALSSSRYGKDKLAAAIVNSLKETSMDSEEMGMYWKANTASWFWYSAPIETQALIIELFTEMGESQDMIDKMKVWLLKNKQTNRWATTKSTTEAIYALMLQGSDWLSISDDLQILIGNKTVDPHAIEDVKTEAGTGYFKTSWNPSEIQPEMSRVTLKKEGKGIAWAGLYWQYFEDLDKITSAETPLKLKKKVFKKINTDYGEELLEVNENNKINLGDLITVRIELRVDRPMEFVHMKDMRASGLEPINVLSAYKWQDGLGYYESTKDAATHFFFDRLNKGVYIFEYDLRANNSGSFSNGITTIQSMYAPEFSSHSRGFRISID